MSLMFKQSKRGVLLAALPFLCPLVCVINRGQEFLVGTPESRITILTLYVYDPAAFVSHVQAPIRGRGYLHHQTGIFKGRMERQATVYNLNLQLPVSARH